MNAPGYVAPEAGFLTQIRLLGQIADSDPKLRLVILLIELTSFGFELASVLGKATSFSPTVYSAVLARDVLYEHQWYRRLDDGAPRQDVTDNPDRSTVR